MRRRGVAAALPVGRGSRRACGRAPSGAVGSVEAESGALSGGCGWEQRQRAACARGAGASHVCRRGEDGRALRPRVGAVRGGGRTAGMGPGAGRGERAAAACRRPDPGFRFASAPALFSFVVLFSCLQAPAAGRRPRGFPSRSVGCALFAIF